MTSSIEKKRSIKKNLSHDARVRARLFQFSDSLIEWKRVNIVTMASEKRECGGRTAAASQTRMWFMTNGRVFLFPQLFCTNKFEFVHRELVHFDIINWHLSLAAVSTTFFIVFPININFVCECSEQTVGEKSHQSQVEFSGIAHTLWVIWTSMRCCWER